MNQTTRQRITGTLVLAVTALILLPVIFDGEGSYQPNVQPDIPPRPAQPQASMQNAQRPQISADSDAIRIRPETPATVIIGADSDTGSDPDNSADSNPAAQAAPASTASAAPATAPTPAPVQAAPRASASAPTPSSAATSSAAPASSSAPANVAALDVQGLPEGWSVRLGSFSNAENVNNLVARLQAAGHRAYTRRIQSDQGMLTAVFVGPQVDRATAVSLMERLRQDFELNGMVVRYEIDPL